MSCRRVRGGAERATWHADGIPSGPRLARAGGRGDPPLQVDTEYVLLLTRENIARSDREVRITRGASSLTGVGMEFDNAARVLTVQSRVRGVWTTPEQR